MVPSLSFPNLLLARSFYDVAPIYFFTLCGFCSLALQRMPTTSVFAWLKNPLWSWSQCLNIYLHSRCLTIYWDTSFPQWLIHFPPGSQLPFFGVLSLLLLKLVSTFLRTSGFRPGIFHSLSFFLHSCSRKLINSHSIKYHIDVTDPPVHFPPRYPKVCVYQACGKMDVSNRCLIISKLTISKPELLLVLHSQNQ